MKLLLVLTILAVPACATLLAADVVPPYKDSTAAVDVRVRDLLGRMTVEEKARQLDMYFGCQDLLDTNRCSDITHAKPGAVFDPARAEKAFGRLGAGAIHDLYPYPALYNAVQSWAIQSSRLGIPALFIEEGLHGLMAHDATVFPQTVNLASTWNPDLARATGAAIAAEARARGIDMLLGPVLDLARDPRWGRVEEDFGEDPYLSGALGLAYVQGMQGDSLDSDHSVIAEPKHFAAHGSPESGLNTAPVHAGEHELRNFMFKSFEPAIRVGRAGAVMVAYHDIDGTPCTGNPWLLNSVLREEWGFQGFALSDLGAIRRLVDTHHVAGAPADAVLLALNSGVDMQFYDFDHAVFQNAIMDGVKSGALATETLNRAAGRVLRAKFLLGLFDKPLVDEKLNATVARGENHLRLSLEVARQSICLLQNRGQLLPLKTNLARIAVIGPNASLTRLGDYADAAQEAGEFAMLAQIKRLVSPQTQVAFADGEDFAQALAAAKGADAVILALGEKHGISGEGFDRSELGLPGKQQALLESLVTLGAPVVLVLQNGRALAIPWAKDHVPAIVEAWYPGEFGGQAIAETLFGVNNPSGKLPVSFPRGVGQLPVYYNHFPSKSNQYVDGGDAPLFVFGEGLSYTTFAYSKLAVAPASAPGDGDLQVSFELANTGGRDGDEVAQVYVRRETSSIATPVKELKAFARFHLRAQESRAMTIALHRADLALWGAARQWSVEPGELTITVGGSSASGASTEFHLQ